MKTKKNITPPRLATWLLSWYCENAVIEDLQGDLEELFYANTKRMPVHTAKLKYWGHVLSLLLSYSVKRRKQHASFHPYSFNTVSYSMLKSYFKISFRSLVKNSSYSIINIAGLAIAVAMSLIMSLFIINEFSYDHHHRKADRIYRVNYEKSYGSNHVHMATTPPMTAHALQQDFPEIEASVRLRSHSTYLVRAADSSENIKEQHVLWTDSSFFTIFSVKVVAGNAATALAEPYTVAISRRIAQKYFTETTAVGNSIILDNRYHATITAVYENMPSTSHFRADILISLAGDWPAAREAQSTVFSNCNFNTYILLKEKTDITSLRSRLPLFTEKYSGKSSGNDFTRLTLMPIRDIHLWSNIAGELGPNGSITYIHLFSTAALFVLLIACINFMNLSTAHSSNRAKEVGVRKVMGSQRSQLIRQFLLESLLITTIAFVISIFLVYLFLPLFNNLLERDLTLPIREPLFYLGLSSAALVTGLLAGAYPSFYLSAFKPVTVLKGQVIFSARGGFLRSGLVVFQFVISILLIIGAFTVNEQLTFIKNKNLGFEKDQVLLIKDAYALRPNIDAFKNEINKIRNVHSSTISGFVPVESGSEFARGDRTFWKEGTEPSSNNLVNIQQWGVDTDYIDTYKMHVVQGRGFSKEFISDAHAVVLNKTAVNQFGLGNDPVGKKILTFSGSKVPDFEHPVPYTVIGVVDDFHFSSMKANISSLGFFIWRSDGFVSVRFDGNPEHIIESLEKIWKQLAPGQPFQYSFLDEEFAKMYANEERLGNLFTIFSTLAIVIACFGLFALTAFTVKKRKKEIGIRKVLGASVSSIMILLSAEFSKLLIVAFSIAIPVAWYGVDWWLENFRYKVVIGPSVYILAGCIVLVIACLTTWHHSYRAASSDPVKSIGLE
jgi:putative ABC transport system permease protein